MEEFLTANPTNSVASQVFITQSHDRKLHTNFIVLASNPVVHKVSHLRIPEFFETWINRYFPMISSPIFA